VREGGNQTHTPRTRTHIHRASISTRPRTSVARPGAPSCTVGATLCFSSSSSDKNDNSIIMRTTTAITIIIIMTIVIMIKVCPIAFRQTGGRPTNGGRDRFHVRVYTDIYIYTYTYIYIYEAPANVIIRMRRKSISAAEIDSISAAEI
jgi:hypothetical protein